MFYSTIHSIKPRQWIMQMLIMGVLVQQPAYAIHMIGELPYAQKMEHPLDQPVNAALNDKAFLMNLGPTGIRAKIEPDEPKAFKVEYVFQDDQSPAKGLINKGDFIIGANGKTFNTPHGFHRKQAFSRGWQGPPFELAGAIEDSQGRDGKLTLIVLKGGIARNRTEITLQLEPVGRFAPTYPWNCPRSEKLLEKLCDFMIENGVTGRHHNQIQQLLALMASGDKRAKDLIKAKAESLMSRPVSYTQTGMVTWGWGYSGIFLGEYYNITKDRGVRDAIDALNTAYEKGMSYASGGFSHRPFPVIEQRVASGGPPGYGAMAGPGGLAMLAMSTFKAVGLPYAERPYDRVHQAYLLSCGQGDNPRASIAYGFGKGWPGTMIRIMDPNTPCKSDEGIGYRVPDGMKGIGEFLVEKWSREGNGWRCDLVAPTGEFSWLKQEADQLLVYEAHGKAYKNDKTGEPRLVIRPIIGEEPGRPFDTQPGGGGHVAPMGMGAAAHMVGNSGNQPWNYLGKHLSHGCALSPEMIFDGHADAVMHGFFSVVGASWADEQQKRTYLDYIKTLLVLSEPHDGQGLVEQPFGCQRNGTCSISRDRRQYTHVAILLLSLPKKALLITGAEPGVPAVATATTRPSRSTYVPPWRRQPEKPEPPPLRPARTLSDEKQEILNRALLRTLTKLDEQGKLQPIGMILSGSAAPIWLKEANADGNLTFQMLNGDRTADVLFDKMKPTDLAALAVLVTRLTPESTDAKAMAAVYMEVIGKVEEADDLFEQAGDESRQKLESLF